MNFNDLFLSVLARKKGRGPDIHRGTAGLLLVLLQASLSGRFRSRSCLWSASLFQDSKSWNWYLEYLFTQGFDGLQKFIQSNINWKPAADDRQSDVPRSQKS